MSWLRERLYSSVPKKEDAFHDWVEAKKVEELRLEKERERIMQASETIRKERSDSRGLKQLSHCHLRVQHSQHQIF